MSSKIYAVEVDIEEQEELDNLEQFVMEGTPVLYCEELSDLTAWNIDPDDVITVEKEEA